MTLPSNGNKQFWLCLRAPPRALPDTVLCAADGEAALKLFESNSERIALVLLDVLMLSGPDALERMQRRKAGLPVLFTTGYSTELTRLELLTRQGAEILQKPYGTTALGQKVREILDRHLAGE